MRYAWPDFKPDLADVDTKVSGLMTNVIPGANSYRPLAGPAPYSDALAADPRGQWLARTSAGDAIQLAATASNIYKLSGTSWGSIGDSYTLSTDEFWAGVQFGIYFYWNSADDGLQKYDLDAGGSISAVGGNSQAAKHMDVVEEYLVYGNTATSPREIEWSATNDGDTYGSGNSGSQIFPDGGPISAICGATNLVIQENIIRRMVPDPEGAIFQFEKLEQSRGSIAPQSVIRFGATIAYLAEDGFWLRSEFESEAIGQNAVNRHFLSVVNENQLYTVLGRNDPSRPLFWWHYRTGETSTYDRALIYNWAVKKWADVEMDVLFASESATAGITLEQLSALYPDLETVPYSLDSRVWLGGRPIYAVIDTDRKLAFLDGDNLAATLRTGKMQLLQGQRARLRGVRPMINNTAATAATRAWNRLGDSASFSSATSQQPSGLVPLNKGGRYHQIEMQVAAAAVWSHSQGLEVPDDMVTPDGAR